MTDTPALLQIQNLHVHYADGIHALHDVSLTVHPAERVGLIGPNGAGKTTLFGCMLGLLNAGGGEIKIDGRDPSDLRTKALLGYLPERMSFDSWMTGRQFLKYHYELSGKPFAGRDQACEETLGSVGLEQAAWNRRIRDYSRGMLQRLGLAQAIIGDPGLLLLDEPTSGMDPAGAAMFRELIHGRCAGATIVINSHQLEQVEKICTRVVFLQNGRIEAEHKADGRRDGPRVLRLRLALDSSRYVEALHKAVKAPRFRMLEARGALLRIEVPSDSASAMLIARLVKAKVPVVEAVPESTALAGLFEENKGRRP
jgi:ABC-2 type transport system ATP-binding protein